MAAPRAGLCAGMFARAVSRKARMRASVQEQKPQIQEPLSDKFSIQSLSDNLHPCEVGTPSISGAFHMVVTSLSSVNGKLLNDSQMRMVDQATVSLADTLLGTAASPSMRLAVRRGLHLAALIAYPAARISTLLGSLTQADSGSNRLTTDAELMSFIATLLSPTASASSCFSLWYRTIAAASAFTVACLNIGAAAQVLSHLDMEHMDVLVSVEKTIDLVSSFTALLEHGQELVGLAEDISTIILPVWAKAAINDGDGGLQGHHLQRERCQRCRRRYSCQHGQGLNPNMPSKNSLGMGPPRI